MRARRIGAVPVVDGGPPVALHLLDEVLAPIDRPNGLWLWPGAAVFGCGP